MAYTTQAKNKIKAFFNRIDKEENLKKGEELLTKELRRKKISTSVFFKDENIDKILDENNHDFINTYDDFGNPIQFEQIAVVSLDEELFVILRENSEDVPFDEVMVFRIIMNETNQELLLEENEEIVEEVFNKFYQLQKKKK